MDNIINFAQGFYEKHEKAKVQQSKKKITNRPRNMPTRYDTGNGLLNLVQVGREKLAKRSENKRFEESQPYGKPSESLNPNSYVVSGMDDKGRGFTERYSSANIAYASEQRHKSKGDSVNAISISGKGSTRKSEGRIPTRIEALLNGEDY